MGRAEPGMIKAQRGIVRPPGALWVVVNQQPGLATGDRRGMPLQPGESCAPSLRHKGHQDSRSRHDPSLMRKGTRQSIYHLALIMFALLATGTIHPPVVLADVNSELLTEAADGNIEKVRQLLEAGADPNYRVRVNGFRPLMMAAYGGHAEIVKLLLEKGADVNAKDNNGETPLLWAASGNRLEVAKLLIENGADVNAKDDDSARTVLMQVSSRVAVFLGPDRRPAEIATEDRVRFVKLLIDNGAEIDAKAVGGRTALMEAAFWGLTEVAQVLIDKGADVNAQDYYGRTALMSAGDNGHTEMVKLLVSRGADVNIRDNEGRKASLWAMTVEDTQRAELPMKAGAKESDADTFSDLLDAIREGDISEVGLLVAGKPGVVHERNVVGWTLLHHLMFDGRNNIVGIAALLLEGGADPNAKDSEGNTPLHFAGYRMRQEPLPDQDYLGVIKVLLSHKADVTIRNRVGATALHLWTVRRADVAAVGLLIDQGADVNARATVQGWTPLHGAVAVGRIDLVEFLLEKGADLTLTDNDGLTPLAVANKLGQADIAELLRRHGAQK